jgi:hypothetical protein
LLAAGAGSAAAQGVPPAGARSGWAPVNASDGAYVSGALGLVWQRGTVNESVSALDSTTTLGANGPGTVTMDTTTNTLSGTAEGRDRGIQAVFSVGYNVVFSSWLIGAQTDASWNR